MFSFDFRRLTSEQKALALAFAETEKNIEGTINDMVQTNKGESILRELSMIWCKLTKVSQY